MGALFMPPVLAPSPGQLWPIMCQGVKKVIFEPARPVLSNSWLKILTFSCMCNYESKRLTSHLRFAVTGGT